MNWIKHPIRLEGNKVALEPLEERHFDELIEVSSAEIIWTYMPVNHYNKEKLREALEQAMAQRALGVQYPFVVIEKFTGNLIGCTRFLKISEEHHNLEIGWTWYLPEYWGKRYNDDCKLLLLTYCFEELKTIRVQIVASEKNMRSRNAILRIGAKFEGILRNKIFRNGAPRSSAYYSIIDDEWPEVKHALQTLVSTEPK